MSSSALLKLHAFHRDLYLHALETAQHFTALDTPEIAAYSRNFQDSLPAQFDYADDSEILEALKQAQFLLYGDFHTLKQSQQGFLSILIEVRELYPDRPLLVALEIFNAADQVHIDDFLTASIPEDVFLKRIDYHNNWGFPWEHYQPIVDYCASKKIKIIGINSKLDSANRLNRRDEFAASILNQLASAQPEHLCLCLIGEHHLADKHLIQLLDPSLRTVRLVANVDAYALRATRLPLASSEYLRLAPDFYCVLNSAPWLKWQSLAMWEEFHTNAESGQHPEEFDPYTEHHYDFDYQLLHMIRSLNKFLNLNIADSELSEFDLYLRPDRATMSYLKSKMNLNRFEIIAAEKALGTDGFYYFSPAKTIVIQDVSINRLAEAAGHFLYDLMHGRRSSEISMIDRVERHACSTIASLLLNPRKITLRAEEIEQANHALKRKRLVGRSRTLREASRLVLPIFEDLLRPDTSLRILRGLTLQEKDRRLGFLISRQIGETVGSALFHGLLLFEDSLLIEGLQVIFKGSLAEQAELLRQLHVSTLKEASAS